MNFGTMRLKITVKDFEKIVKSLHFLHLISKNWLVLQGLN